MRGIDVSVHNGSIDWQAVKKNGYEFAITRLGYGTRNLDKNFISNLTNARGVGLKTGVYFYSYALNVEDAKAEALFVQQILQENSIDPELGIWFDMEDADGYKERHGMPDNQTITDICSAFVSEMNTAGYRNVGIYASYSWLTDIIDTSQLVNGVLYWNAQWGNTNDFPLAKMWQFTDSLDINGQIFDGNEYYD